MNFDEQAAQGVVVVTRPQFIIDFNAQKAQLPPDMEEALHCTLGVIGCVDRYSDPSQLEGALWRLDHAKKIIEDRLFDVAGQSTQL